MPYRLIFRLLALTLALCSATASSNAQSQGCISGGDWFVGGQPPGAFDCVYAFNLLVTCLIPNGNCPPPAAAQETHCGASCSAAGKPIDLATGNTYIEEVDIRLPGLSGGLKLVRTWNSEWPSTQNTVQAGLFGPNWRSTFEERVSLGSDNYVKYARSDGSFWSFGYNGANSNGASLYIVAAPANASATLTLGTANWTLTFKNGEQRLFDLTTGNLVAIVDRNGNTISVSYDAAGRLSTVTDAVGRHLYLSYIGNGFLVTGVTSDVGVSLSYSYDTLGRLIQVTEPDLSTISFQYDSNSFIAVVLDSQGKVLESHTYDSSGRGLTSSRANGVDLVTASYPSQ